MRAAARRRPELVHQHAIVLAGRASPSLAGCSAREQPFGRAAGSSVAKRVPVRICSAERRASRLAPRRDLRLHGRGAGAETWQGYSTVYSHEEGKRSSQSVRADKSAPTQPRSRKTPVPWWIQVMLMPNPRRDAEKLGAARRQSRSCRASQCRDRSAEPSSRAGRTNATDEASSAHARRAEAARPRPPEQAR